MENEITTNERVHDLAEKLSLLLQEDRFREVREAIEGFFPVEIADALVEMDNPKYGIVLLRLLPNETAADIFTYLSTEMQEEIVQTMNNKEIRNLMSEIFT
ncbi:hypothetical protein Zmor_008986, partial [Zophobas morio]